MSSVLEQPRRTAGLHRSRVARDGDPYVLRGRDDELALVADMLDRTVRGGGGMLIVEGAGGVGKSSVLDEAHELARGLGVRTLSGQAFESQQAVPFGPLLAATVGADPPIGDGELSRGLGSQAELRFWMLHDLQRALESAARETPLLISLDDVQWVDPGTLVALDMLPVRLSGAPILWMLATRAGHERPELRDTVERLERHGARRLRLGGLSEEAVVAIVEDALGVPAGPDLLGLAENAQGNPFLLVELLHGLVGEGRVRIEDGRAILLGDHLPARLTDSMRQRLGRLGSDAHQVVQLAAVLGSRCSVEQLAAMLERRPSSLVGSLEELLRADLLVELDDRLAFRHDLLRQAVLDTLPRALRRALRREAATVLLAGGAAPVEVAHELAASAEVGDREAIATLREAARVWSGSDVSAAADLSVRALELMLPVDEERAPLVAETVMLLHSAMRSDAARELGERALAGALPPEDEADVRLSLSSMFGRSTEYRIEENRRALALPGLTPTMRARHLSLLAYNLVVGGHAAAGAAAVGPALAAAAETGDIEARVMSTLAAISIDATQGRCSDALARIAELRGDAGAATPLPFGRAVDLQEVRILAGLGRLDEALALQAEILARGRRDGNAWILEVWPEVGCGIALAAGRLAEARADAGCSEVVSERLVAGSINAASAMSTLAQVALHTGDAKQLKLSLESARRALRSSSPAIRRHGAWAMALAAMARDEPHEAVDLLADGELPYAAAQMPIDAGYQPTVARIAVAAGDHDLARRALELSESLARQNPGVPLFAATAAQTRGLVERDASLLVEAARLLGSTQRPLLTAEALEDAGRALAREGRTRASVELLGEAFDAFAELDAGADARRVGRLLREHGVRRRVGAAERPASGWGSLTESELRVARLVAGGATNRDAATQLYVSPHTVSSHLRSAFEKLEVTSRVALARIVLREDQGAEARA